MTTTSGQMDPSERERRRAQEEHARWLGRRGVRLDGDEDGEELVNLREAIEQFEAVVEEQGGDLMVDEPVHLGQSPSQPDNHAFALPTRSDDESIEAYTERVIAAAEAAEQGPAE